MTNLFKKYKPAFVAGIILVGITMVSCEKYLDKAPEASITEKDVYGTFISYQGFVEELYGCIVDYGKPLPFYNFNFADEVLENTPLPWDDGNYWNRAFLLSGSTVVTGNSPVSKRVWPNCWYGIRKANLGLSKLDLFTGTPEEKNIIKGQCLFFRAWFYFELMRFWGGLPYIDKVLTPTDELLIPRLNYRETALKAAADFKEAASLLPVVWDATETGNPTLGNNQQRITKIHALSYLGKDLLYAASPMMNEESTGSATFDAGLCKDAAIAFADVIKICKETGAYKLQDWATWTDNFWVWAPGESVRSGGTEVIMNPTIYIADYPRWTTCRTSLPVQFGAGNNVVEVPTQNYVKYYGMANGLPITDPLSGYNPNDPWVNRDPRFYKDIVVDGDRMVTSNAAGQDQYAKLYNGGRHKGGSTGSVTGFYYRKWTPLGNNPWDNRWKNFQTYVPYMRLADVYLMYAEAALQGYGSSSGTVPGSNLTAEDAVNVIRNRATLPNIGSNYTASKDNFMEAIILERAVELAFEAHRFFDLRRWNLSGNAKYLQKTALEFDRNASGKPINFKERVVVTRVYEKKHNWFPFDVSDTKLYKEFPQNPGW